MLYPIKVNTNTIELTMHITCYCVIDDLLCVIMYQPALLGYRYLDGHYISSYFVLGEKVKDKIINKLSCLIFSLKRECFLLICTRTEK